MPISQLYPGIYQLELPAVNVFLLRIHTELILIDTGPAQSKGKLFAMIRETGNDPYSIKHIVITHVHYDHSGALRAIRNETDARVYIHEHDASLLEKGIAWQPASPFLRGLICLITFNRRIRLPYISIRPVKADVIVREGDLICGALQVIEAPGHWPGQIVLICGLYGGILFAADSAQNFKNPELSSENRDKELAKKTLRKIAARHFEKAVFGHGKPLQIHASDLFRKLFGSQDPEP